MSARAAARWRPRLHFTPPHGWMNDPNGLVYAGGRYHLFYQHNPGALTWGDIHWGHASSTDLLSWSHHPPALAPHPELGMVFSGCAVVDHQNTSGLGGDGAGEVAPVVALFTHAIVGGAQVQSLAYSLDDGATWREHPGNPVIPNPGVPDFRDPKVLWHAPSAAWVMVLAAGDEMQIWRSPDLLRWTWSQSLGEGLGDHGGVWECPDLFELPVEGTDERRWVLLISTNPGGPNGGSATHYLVGDFDGARFTPEPSEAPLYMDYGPDSYAGVTWSDAPGDRRLQIAWMSNWDYCDAPPTEPWRGAMTLPRALSLESTPAGPRLRAQPISELAELRSPPALVDHGALRAALDLPGGGEAPVELVLGFTRSGARGALSVVLEGEGGERVSVTFDPRSSQLTLDRSQALRGATAAGITPTATAPLTVDEQLTLHILVDTSSIEVFAQGGAQVLTAQYYTEAPLARISVAGDAAWGGGGALYALQRGLRPPQPGPSGR